MFTTVVFLLALLAVSQGRGISNSDVNTRIVNGQDAKIGEFPFQVSLQKASGHHFCGGSVLSANYVLTAAHCLKDETPEGVFVVAGTINRKIPHSKHQVTEFKIHEGYYNVLHDIALVKIDPPFQFSDLVAPLHFPSAHEVIPANTKVVVSGWGRLISPNSTSLDILQKAEIYVADQQYCYDKNREVHRPIFPTNICAYDPSTRRGQCNGDSGGPLSIGRKVIGIVSHSEKGQEELCGSTIYPGVYTRVSEYIDWIVAHATV